MIAISGLLLHSLGIFLMLRYRLPEDLPRLGVVVHDLTTPEAAEDDRRKAIGMIGLVVFAAGGLLLAISFARAAMY